MRPWWELLELLPQLNSTKTGILIDLGAGNGRNLVNMNRTLVIAIDISWGLLHNYLGKDDDQRILGSVANVPIRRNCSGEIMSIAVIHHLETEKLRQKSINEIHRIASSNAEIIISVWRKWRSDWKEKLFKVIRQKGDIRPLVDHLRPWQNEKGETLSYRFYHYYTWKELFRQIKNSDLELQRRKIFGGKNKDANFLVILSKK